MQNTTNLKVLRELMTPDVTYVSLNFNNPELKTVEPWAGTHKGPQELADVFGDIQRCWKTLDFKVTDTIEQGNRVAFFGSFTYKSNVTGKELHLHLVSWRVSNKVAYVQFLEDSYGTAGSFKTGGTNGSTAIPLGKSLRSNAALVVTKIHAVKTAVTKR